MFSRLFVGGYAFSQPRGVIMLREVEFSVFQDLGLLEEDRLAGSRPEPKIDGDLHGVFSYGGRVGIVAGEGVPVGDEIQAVVGRIVLETDPVLEGAEVVADVEAPGGAHTGENAIGGGGQEVRSSIDGMSAPS
jgi:hypothetical protein